VTRKKSLASLPAGRLFQIYSGTIYVVTAKGEYARYARLNTAFRDISLHEFQWAVPMYEIVPTFAGPARLRVLAPPACRSV
jgi:hypothetical protein